MRRVVFLDESGRKSPCNCVIVGAVIAQVSGSYAYWGLGVVDEIKKAAGIRGELKWRAVKRRGAVELVLSVLSRLETRWVAIHYVDKSVFESDLWRFLVDLDADLYVLDVGLADPRKFPRAVARPSHKVPGIQLADLLAGWAAETARGCH